MQPRSQGLHYEANAGAQNWAQVLAAPHVLAETISPYFVYD